MAYSAPSSRSTSDLITATIWNADVVANPIAIYAGAMSVTSQASGDILYASSTTQLGRVGIGSSNQVLTSSGSAPQWTTQLVNAALPTNIDVGGTLDVTGDTTLDGDLVVSGTGPHAFGAVATDYIRTYIAGNYTSGGASTALYGLFHAGALTGHADDSSGISGMRLDTTSVTAGNATLVAQLNVNEPGITVGSGTVTNSAAVYVQAAASEATNNYALWVDAGDVRFDGATLIACKDSPYHFDIYASNASGAGAQCMAIQTNNGSAVATDRLIFTGDEATSDVNVINARLGVGFTGQPDGMLHVQSASAGSVTPHANADELVVEGSGNSGITILAGATSTANVFFGDAGNSSEGAIYFTNNATTASLNIQNEFGYINLLPSGGAATGVGVGVNDPDVMLDVSGGDNVLDIFRITQRASGAAAYGLQVGLAATGDPVFQRLVNDVATESFRIVRATGDVTMAEDLSVTGALSKGSGSFKIDHPLPAKTDTHHLIHSFIEGPRCDLIYRGTVTLVDGTAQVDLDDAAGMTSGTWVLLCRDEQCFTSNETGWQHVRGTVSGSTLTIDCEEAICTDTVSWMVVASRKDQHIMETDWTDEDGYPIIEPLKPDPEPDPE